MAPAGHARHRPRRPQAGAGASPPPARQPATLALALADFEGTLAHRRCRAVQSDGARPGEAAAGEVRAISAGMRVAKDGRNFSAGERQVPPPPLTARAARQPARFGRALSVVTARAPRRSCWRSRGPSSTRGGSQCWKGLPSAPRPSIPISMQATLASYARAILASARQCLVTNHRTR
jgi:hypothetical protein